MGKMAGISLVPLLPFQFRNGRFDAVMPNAIGCLEDRYFAMTGSATRGRSIGKASTKSFL
jgi:hypothetical protein